MKRMILHPSSGSGPATFCRLQWSGRSRDTSFLPNIWLVIAGMVARSPFFALEDALFGAKIRRLEVESGPIFIIGHWRSGTTFLHNILSGDERFGYLSMARMVAPNDMLLSRYLPVIPLLLRLDLPRTRGIDDVALSVDAPQEEEIALGILSGVSYYNCYYFPHRFAQFFDDAIDLEHLDARTHERFAEAYRRLVAKLTLLHDGRPLMLKNPSSTARIRLLKQLFPRAKFIHIRRNPYAVFASSLARLPEMIHAFRLRTGGEVDHEEQVLRSYRKLMRSYLEQREAIPAGDLVEVSYEDLLADPHHTVTSIHDQLGIPSNDRVLDGLDGRVRRDDDSNGPRHSLSGDQVERIEREWRFALDEWGYEFPGDVAVVDQSEDASRECPNS